MKNFTTRTECVAYLVEQGKPEALAKAAINESFNFDNDGETSDLCRFANSWEPIVVSEELVIEAYETMFEMLEITPEGIELDGELAYDLEGNRIK